MTEASPIRDNETGENESETHLRQVRTLGTSPAGESYEIVRLPVDQEFDRAMLDDQPHPARRFVLKKLTRSRLRSPEDFRQKFSALCRLEHDNLCPYRDLYVGEHATRVTREYVEGIPLDEYLLQPITDEERRKLAGATDPAEDPESPDQPPESDGEDGASSEGDEPDLEEVSDAERESDSASRDATGDAGEDSRPSTLEIPAPLMEDSEAANRALDLIILRLRRIVPKLIDALEYLHRFRQVHGNLTPSNILVTPEGEPMLTDYGLHPELYIPPEARQRHQSYHAPEVARGEFRPASDLYALGAILFEALADRPYGARRKKETPDGTDTEYAPVYLSEIAPHCPATWVDLIHALLTPDPDERPSLDEVHRQLAATETRSVNIPASIVEDPETLYGRRESLEQLMERAQDCSQHRHLGISIVEGETGVGKTALLDALARRTAQRGWVVLHGRCFHREPVAYQGWERVVDRLATIAESLPDKSQKRLRGGRRRASRLFPQLAPDDESRPDVGRRAAVEGLRHVLTELSEQRPILICFDDIHWAGWDSARLLADLAEAPDDIRLMIAATWRPNAHDDADDEPFWCEMSTAPVDVGRISIEGFSKSDARNYVVTHGNNLSLRQKQKVLRRGGLNPLLIDELIHELDEDSDAVDADEIRTSRGDADGGSPDHDDRGTDSDVDHYLQTFIEERIDELSRAERLVLQLLAIASGPLGPGLLTQAMDREIGTQTTEIVTGREVAESLVEQRLARRARRIEPSREERPRYVIVHDLCRRVVLDELGRDHHARLCGLIADTLASGSNKSDDLRFEYLLRAGRGDEASRAAVLAARTAIDRFAFHRATRLWTWLADRDELDERDRPDFARALLGAGHFRDAIAQFDRLLPSSSKRADLHRRRRRIEAHLSAGDRPGAVEAMNDAMAATSTPYLDRTILDRIDDLRRRITTAFARWSDAAAIAEDTALDDETAARADLYDFALQTAPFLRSEPTDTLARRFGQIAASTRSGPLLARDRLWMVGAPWLPFLVRDGEKFDRWTRQANDLAGTFEAPVVRARSLETTALLARHRGHLREAADQTDRARQLVEVGDMESPLLYARLMALRTDVALLDGEPKRAGDLVDRLVHHFRHHRWLASYARLSACDRCLYVGDLEAAHDHLEQIGAFVGDDRNCLLHVWSMERRTRLCIARGRPEVAVGEWDLLVDSVYSRSLRRRPRVRALLHYNRGIALAARADREKSFDEPHLRDTLRRLRRAIRRLGDLESWFGRYDRSRLFRLRSRYQLLRDRPERALHYAERAAEIAGDDPPALVAAMNRETAGTVLLESDSSKGRLLIEEARDIFDDVGAYLPLVLEGWPVPETHARLREER